MTQPRRSILRAIPTVALWLILGVVITYGSVIWSIAVVRRQQMQGGWTDTTRGVVVRGWPVPRSALPADWPELPEHASVRAYTGVDALTVSANARTTRPGADAYWFCWRTDAGLPLRAFRGAGWMYGVMGRAAITESGRGQLWELDTPRTRGLGPLPLRPLLPGLAVDAALYGAIAWALWRTPRTVQRVVWRATGRCARCGYDRAGLAADVACPECGRGPA